MKQGRLNRQVNVGPTYRKKCRMTENNVNVPLLRKAVEWAEAEAALPTIDSRWYQGQWIAEPYDVAYSAALEQLGNEADFGELDRLAQQLEPQCKTAFCIAGWVLHEQGLTKDQLNEASENGTVPEDAASALGLSYEQSAPLFAGRNTIEDVRRIAEGLAGERL